jgi:hypothetical protein
MGWWGHSSFQSRRYTVAPLIGHTGQKFQFQIFEVLMLVHSAGLDYEDLVLHACSKTCNTFIILSSSWTCSLGHCGIRNILNQSCYGNKMLIWVLRIVLILSPFSKPTNTCFDLLRLRYLMCELGQHGYCSDVGGSCGFWFLVGERDFPLLQNM